MADRYSRQGDGFLAIVKTEDEEDDDCIALPAPSAATVSKQNPKDRYRDQLSMARSVIGQQDTNGNTGAATHVPVVLHDFYRQSAAVYKSIDYTCALCSRSLKCRSARDMRDHALSHGGNHWASAFRCLLCSYHSHSRRSVSKHVTTVHLIPDGVQCAPGELMENETLSRADELLALVRDCFPLPSNAVADRNVTGGQVGNEMIDDGGMALPVETDCGMAMGDTPQEASTSGPLDGLNGDSGSPAFGIIEAESDEYEAEGWKPSSPKGAAEGWTVVDDSADVIMGSEYNDSTSVQEPEDHRSNTFPNYPSMTANLASGLKTNPRTAVLEGLLRDFQFQPSSFPVSKQPEAPVRTTFRAPPPPNEEPADDPRALIERLLDVVAPDVARFLLEEAIRARAKAAAAAASSSSVPTIENVQGSVSMVSQVRQTPMGVTKLLVNARPVIVAIPKPANSLTAVANRIKDRLGKLGTFKCPECESVFKRRRYLERHVRARHRLHCYRCTMPGCQFMNARELWYVRRHHAKHHADEKNLVCRICSKRFPNSDEITSRHHACCSVIPTKSEASRDGSNPIKASTNV